MTVFVSRSSRALSAIGIAAIGGAAFATLSSGSALDALRSGAIATFLCVALFVAFWRPKLIIGDTGVVVVNPFATHALDWGAITRIDTKWGLTLFTADGRVTVWATPAPGRHAALTAARDQGRHLPESTYVAGTIRPGDLVTSESGSAAAVVREHWQRRGGDGGRVTTRVQWPLVAVVGLAAVAAAVALFA